MAATATEAPSGYHTVTPYLTIKGAAKAIDFYKFGWVDAFFRVRTRLGKIDPLPPHVIRRLRRR